MIQTEHQRRAYLKALGIDVWVPNDQAQAAVDDVAANSLVDPENLSWSELREAVAVCTRCALHKSRTQTVFGVGNKDADWLIIGEAPGAEEDRPRATSHPATVQHDPQTVRRAGPLRPRAPRR